MPGLPRRFLLASLLCSAGCAGTTQFAQKGRQRDAKEVASEVSAYIAQVGSSGLNSAPAQSKGASHASSQQVSLAAAKLSPKESNAPVSSRRINTSLGKLELDGKTYNVQLVEAGASGRPVASNPAVRPAEYNLTAPQASQGGNPANPPVPDATISGNPIPIAIDGNETQLQSVDFSGDPALDNVVQLNLPSALATVDSTHPVIGFTRWQVQQAYAELAQAKTLWLPSIQAGMSFHRHDGNYQASNGQIVDVNRNSFQYGLGSGAVGAGTTPRPGLVAQFHLADALFQPKIQQKSAWARGHSASAALNSQLLTAGLAYLDLLAAHQTQHVVQESQQRFAELAKISIDFAEAGQGLQADADRLRTELSLTDNRLIAAEEAVAVASSRLALALSLDANVQILPMDTIAVPLEMVADTADKGALIGTALSHRPELKEAQALVAVACDAYQREKYAPLVPSILLGMSTSGFGGGLGSSLSDVDGRYDLDALMSWEIRNLGLGEHAVRRQRAAQIQQAKFEKVRTMDEVAQQVAEAHAQCQFRRRQLAVTRQAIETATDSHKNNLERIRDGQGLPLEVLQSIQALEAAQQAYLEAVIAFNRAQLQLQWSLGWPVSDAF